MWGCDVGTVAKPCLAVCTDLLACKTEHELWTLGENELAVDWNGAIIYYF